MAEISDNIDVKMEDVIEPPMDMSVVPTASLDPRRLKSEIKTEDSHSGFDASRPSLDPKVHRVVKQEKQEVIEADIQLKMEPGQTPKLARRSSQKFPPRAVTLYEHLPDATFEAKSSFDVLEACSYANKMMGYTEAPLECDCNEEWGPYSVNIFTRHEY